MCRNIRVLHNFEPPASEDEVHAAALQYVRKVSGATKPSAANQAAFDRAVHEIAHITRHLLDELVTSAPPKDRETEAAKARARAAERYARTGCGPQTPSPRLAAGLRTWGPVSEDPTRRNWSGDRCRASPPQRHRSR